MVSSVAAKPKEDCHESTTSHRKAGESVHTRRHRPWELDVVIAFRDEARALGFERYLKSGSGYEFAQRHFRNAN
jgi:predicted GIY-YIG superfamily endonuclease